MGVFTFVLTQTVIVMEYLAGAGNGDGDELVVNRIVANVVGILMATLLAIIPPTCKGSDPQRYETLLEEIKTSSVSFIAAVLEDTENDARIEKLKKLRKGFSLRFGLARTNVKCLLEDAIRGTMFPVYKIDEAIEEQSIQLTATSSFVSFWMDAAVEAIQKGNGSFFAKGTESYSRLESSLCAIEDEKLMESTATGPVKLKGDEAEVFLGGVEIITRRIAEHKSVLGSLRPSPLFRKKDSQKNQNQ